MIKLSIVNFAPLTNQTYIQLLFCLRASRKKISVQNKINEECLVEMHEPMNVFVDACYSFAVGDLGNSEPTIRQRGCGIRVAAGVILVGRR